MARPHDRRRLPGEGWRARPQAPPWRGLASARPQAPPWRGLARCSTAGASLARAGAVLDRRHRPGEGWRGARPQAPPWRGLARPHDRRRRPGEGWRPHDRRRRPGEGWRPDRGNQRPPSVETGGTRAREPRPWKRQPRTWKPAAPVRGKFSARAQDSRFPGVILVDLTLLVTIPRFTRGD